MMKVRICSALFTIGLLGGLGASNGTVYAASNEITVSQQTGNPFTDVQADHYAYEAIQWAKEKGIVTGYSDKNGKPNGKFGPNDSVTEAQFVKMVASYLELTDDAGNIVKTTTATHWADTYYDAMAKYGVPLNGYFDDKIRSKPIKRGTLAQAIGYLLGSKANLTDSINYMLSKEITSGQNPQYEGKDLYKFFGSTNNLTRSQVASFLYRMDSKNLNVLSGIAYATAGSTESLDSRAKEGISYIDKSIAEKAPVSITQPVNRNPSFNDDFFSTRPQNPSLQNDFFLDEKELSQYKKDVEKLNKENSKFDNVEDALKAYADFIVSSDKSGVKITDTPLSKKIDKIVNNTYTKKMLGEKDYMVYAYDKNNKQIYSYFYQTKEIKDCKCELDVKHSVILTRGNHLKDFDLYSSELKDLLIYMGLSESEIKETLEFLSNTIKDDYDKTKNYSTTGISDTFYLFDSKVIIRYSDAISIDIK